MLQCVSFTECAIQTIECWKIRVSVWRVWRVWHNNKTIFSTGWKIAQCLTDVFRFSCRIVAVKLNLLCARASPICYGYAIQIRSSGSVVQNMIESKQCDKVFRTRM